MSFPPPTGHPSHAALTGDQAAHLARVLRAEPGQIFDVVAAGFLHRAEIISVAPARVDFLLHEELAMDAVLPVHLYLAVFKFDHLEWGIEKATELGVQAITPVLARRTEKHLAQAAMKRVERWRRIAHEAAQQSRRTTVPQIAEPATLKVALAAATAASRFLLSEVEQQHTLGDALRQTPNSPDYAMAVGPEGGWTADEIELLTAQGWVNVTLGPRILRAETAALAALAIFSALL